MLLLRRQEGLRVGRLAVAAAHEHLRQRVADAELAAQPRDELLGRARGDLEADARARPGEVTAGRGRNGRRGVAVRALRASGGAWRPARSRRMPSR